MLSLCVCEVTVLYVTKEAGGGGGGGSRRHPGYRIKNKNPTQRCGEQKPKKMVECIENQNNIRQHIVWFQTHAGWVACT